VAGRRLAPAGSALAAAALSPAVAKGCRVTTGVAIAFTLIII
jgi:hypothetical protein